MTRESVLNDVRALVGDAKFREFELQCQRAVQEDMIALDKACRDLRTRNAQRNRERVREPGGWLFRAWAEQRRLELKHREEGCRR
jgi:hypothetical protein